MRKTKQAGRAESVTVEDLGDRRVVHVTPPESTHTWDLVAFKERQANEPRIHDLELARRLGYKDPLMIRKLIKSLIRTNKLNDSDVLYAQSESTNGRPGKEFWLTEAGALKVAAKSGTDEADAVLDEMIHVYRLAMRGLLPQQSTDPAQLSNFLIKLDRLEASNQELQTAHRQGMIDLARQNQNLQAQIIQLQSSHESGVIGSRLAKTEINSPLSDYARIMARVDLTQGFRAHCSRAHTELRDEIEYPAGQGADWRYLSREKFGKAQRVVRKMLSRAIKALNAIQAVESKKASSRQSSFKYDN